MNRRQACQLVGGSICQPLTTSSAASMGRLLKVGPSRAIQTIGAAARLAQPGDVIEVDAGNYLRDVAVWKHDNLTVRAVDGRARLGAGGADAEGKGIWVIRAKNMKVEGFDFIGTAVPSRNGAGIRFERGTLLVRNCRFMHNEMGLLTNHDPDGELDVVNCEFAWNHRPDGHNHNLYVGRIARLSVTGSYFHHAHIGHLLKSRAALNYILYNRLTDETGGSASYELEFPNGGVAYVVGNVIEQNRDTENRHLISIGAEGYHWSRNTLHLAHNTLINPLTWGGVYLRVASGKSTVRAISNVLLGSGSLEAAGPGDYRNNLHAQPDDFANVLSHDFRLRRTSDLIGRALAPEDDNGQGLQPDQEYVHPCSTRRLARPAENPGAMQTVASLPTS